MRPGDATEARRTAVVIAWTCAVVVVVRLLYVAQPMNDDEGGYLYVARHWRAGREFLYGDYFVDRPPLLVSIFRLAALSDWDHMVKVLALPLTLSAVLALARAGFLTAGWRGARWAAVVAAALLCSPVLSAGSTNGELVGMPFVAASLALWLEAWRRRPDDGQLRCALAAGKLSGAAALVKQNLLDGFVFAMVLVAAETLHHRRVSPRGRAVALGALAGAGAASTLAIASAAHNGSTIAELWADLVAFRGAAWALIWAGHFRAPMSRAVWLIGAAVISGLVPLTLAWLKSVTRTRRRCSPQMWAVTGTLLFEVWAVIGGGSYWGHYLLQLTPAVALATGMLAAEDEPVGLAVRRRARAAVASSAVAFAIMAVVYATVPSTWDAERTGGWLASAAAPGDTAYVAYGSPSVLEAANLPSPYPYLWSLPMRTLDPDQNRLRHTLLGPHAPTWVVQVLPLNSWQIDHNGRLGQRLAQRYDQVATVCGHPVFLRSNVKRSLPPRPTC